MNINRLLLFGLIIFSVNTILSAQTKTITFQELSVGFGVYFGADITPTTITLTIKGPDDKWFAVGFGGTNMFGTDALIYTTGKSSADPQYVYDYYLTSQNNNGVNKDAQQDWTISSITTFGGERTIVASRALNTGDADDYVFDYNATSLSIIFSRDGSATYQLGNHGNGNSNFAVLTINNPCNAPTLPTISATNSTICFGSSTTLSLNASDSLKSASKWYLYSGSCGGTLLDSSATDSFIVSPTVTTNYFIRGEGNCVTPGTCGNISITVISPTTSTINPVVCNTYTSPSGSYTWTTSNTYMDTIANLAGCDSVITINLTVNSSSSSTINPVVCDSYTSPSGNYTWTTSNTYMDTIPNAVSCDSVITINLTVNNATSSTINPVVCDSYTSPSGNYTWTSSNTYMDTIPNAVSCDSVITINLTVNNASTNTISPIACDSYTSPSGNYTWSTSNTYMDTIPNAVSCDSVITINLTVNNATSSIINPVVCDSYTSPSGNYTWITTNTYFDTIPNAVSCDSVITINLTVNNTTSSTINPVVCDSYTSPSGNYTWTTSNTYLDTIPNAVSCDSVIIINLTVNNKTSSTINPVICDSYTSPSGNYIWTASGNYTDTIPNAAGCDSIITINLTVNNSSSSMINPIVCESYTSPSGNYIWTSSNTYFDTILNAANCDSVMIINLTVNNTTSSTINPVACDSYNSPSGNYSWTTSNTYLDTINNAAGCDSVITINLTIKNSSNSTINPVRCNTYNSPSGNFTWTTSGSYFDTIPNAIGCDSVISINLTIKNSTSNTINPVVCDSYTSPSGNNTWTTSNTYMDTIPNAVGCDSIITINLTIQQSTFSSIFPVECDSFLSPSGNYTWYTTGVYLDTVLNGVGCNEVVTVNLTVSNSSSVTISPIACDKYTSPSGNYIWTASGTYNDTITGGGGCNSYITVNLTVNYSSFVTINPIACNKYISPSGNYTWTSSNTYMDTLMNASGCDSIVTVNLTINNSTTGTINPVVCDSYTSPSGNYTWITGGTYTDTILNAVSCDSIITINLTVNYSSQSTINPVLCDSYTSPSGNYIWTNTNTYFDTIPNTVGCDSLITINLTVNYSGSSIINPIACDSYTSPSGNYNWTTSNTYLDTISNYIGCDSVITVNLTVYNSSTSTINPIVCDSYTSPSGNYIWTTGNTYIDTINNAVGCDSIITVNLTVNNSSTSTINPIACYSYTSPSGNYIWTASNTYTDTISNSANCDSIITVNLTVNNSSTSTINPVVCDSYTSPSGNYNWTIGSTYLDTINNAVGCDSIITVNLTVKNSSSSTINPFACNSYSSPSGNYTWTTSNTYTDIINNAVGCDSIITVNLTVNNSSSSTINPVVCNSYTSPSGSYTWTTSNTYMDTMLNAVGCDSIINVNLTVNNSSSNTINPVVCDSYTSPSGNYVWTNSNIYIDTITNASNCDSIITINLTVNNTTSNNINPIVCGSYISPSGNFIWTSTNTYFDTITNAFNCDSIITINLTVNNSSSGTINQTGCDTLMVNNQVYTSSGTYTQLLTNSMGCDSTLTLNVTINQSVSTNLSASICHGENYEGYTGFGTYIDVFTAINGCDSTRQLDLTVLPKSIYDTAITIIEGDSILLGGAYQTTTGIYVDTLTNTYGCDSINTVDLSVIVGINETLSNQSVKIYPNPTTGLLNIKLSQPGKVKSIRIYNIVGEELMKIEPVKVFQTINVNPLNTGMYFIRIETDKGHLSTKFLKE